MQAARHAGLASLSHSCIFDSTVTNLRVFELLKNSRFVATDSSHIALKRLNPSTKCIIGSGLKEC